MPIKEANALSVLDELIRKSETNGTDIPRIWQEIIDVYNRHYSSPIDEPKKKRRRKGTKPAGWPKGVSQKEFKSWKESQLNKGSTEVSPHDYKRLRDAGMATASTTGNSRVLRKKS